MFVRSDHAMDQGGGAAALTFGRAHPAAPSFSVPDDWRRRIAAIDWAPDLGAQIGSAEWFRGAATCIALCTATILLSPGFDRPLIGDTPPPLTGEAWEQARAQSIAPLAWGGTTGRRMAAGDLVRPLAETPERPIIQLTATLGSGDSFTRVLQRAGVSRDDAEQTADMVSDAVALNAIRPGTQLDLTLGRRASRSVPRPLEHLRFRARFDLNLAVARQSGQLAMIREPIAIDHSPLRVRGLVGSSLYRSARAAGAPAKAVEAFIRAVAAHVSIGGVGADQRFDLIVEQARAATGEVQMGQLLFAGLDQGKRKLQLVRWQDGGRSDWFDASGVGERRGTMAMPVDARITSGFGMRYHPILNFMRMHKGLDFGAPYGAPIRATTDGVVSFAGRSAGYGNFVKINHAAGLASGYGHMSRIAVRGGERVRRGEVIGYVGSTGMSTGPHLHYELWRNGVAINPRSVSFTTTAQLSGESLRKFRARVATLLAVPASGQ